MDNLQNEKPPAATGGRANAIWAISQSSIAKNRALCNNFGQAELLCRMLDNMRSALAEVAEQSGDIRDMAIACLDMIDSDPDCENDGDESDGQFLGDEPAAYFRLLDEAGAGCPLSDPGGPDNGI